MSNGLSLPDEWTQEELDTRYDVRNQAPGFNDLGIAQQQALEAGWQSQHDVAEIWIPFDANEEIHLMLNSMYETMFHMTAAVAPADEPG